MTPTQNQNDKIIDRVLKLSQTRTNERNLRILADSIIELLTNESDINDPNTFKYVNTLLNKVKTEKKKKATLSKIIKTSDLIKKEVRLVHIQKEQISWIVCQKGYRSNDKDLMGVYVFANIITMCPDKVVSHSEEMDTQQWLTLTQFILNTIKIHIILIEIKWKI